MWCTRTIFWKMSKFCQEFLVEGLVKKFSVKYFLLQKLLFLASWDAKGKLCLDLSFSTFPHYA